MITAFHSNWTRPFFYRNENKEYYIEDFEILTTILSALKWRELNGSIKMITDTVGKAYYESLGIDDIWDLGIENSLDNIDKNINPDIFWACGKIYALSSQLEPIVMIDTDFIVWRNIYELLEGEKVAVIHVEDINESVYPNKKYFKFKNKYKINDNFNWDIRPCNTAFTYISNKELKDFYVKTSIEFMKNAIVHEDKIKYMVFAEQRLISMCCNYKNINIRELSTLEYLNSSEQDLFTHTWGFKDIMRNDEKIRANFCIRCINRIIKDYPYMRDKLNNIKVLNKYINTIE